MEKKSFFVCCRNLMLSISAGIMISLPDVLQAGIESKETPVRFELLFWSAVQNSTNPEEFEAYVEVFPDGRFVRLAKVRAKALRRSAQESSVVHLPVAEAPIVGTPAGEQTAPVSAAAVALPANAEQIPVEIKPDEVTLPFVTAVPSSGDFFRAFNDCDDCPKMVGLNAGTFTMGSVNELDRADIPHTVEVDYPFAISQYEITAGQWNQCVDMGGCTEIEGNRGIDSVLTPAVCISYRDAQHYVSWISQLTGNQYRLPTETEWEYAARAGTTSDYWWGDQPKPAFANCRGCGGNWDDSLPAEVDEFPANPFGLYAVSGGVSEWVQGCWKSPGAAPVNGDCKEGVLRGGSWRNDPDYLRSATRIKFNHDVRYLTNGFRVVRLEQ